MVGGPRRKNFLDCGVIPFLRNASDALSAFEMIPMLPPGSLRTDIFQCCLDKPGTDISVLGDGFRALRAVLELDSEAGWDKFKPLRELASSRQDDDNWTLNDFLYQLGDTVSCVCHVPKPDKGTSRPTSLDSPRSWLQHDQE